jgi:hypothetical protein
MKYPSLPASPKPQKILNLTIAREVEIDGIQMGVMSDGTAYLTGRGLAAMCGVVHSVIQELTNNWESEQSKPRGMTISNMLHDTGYGGPLFIPIVVDGSPHHAYPAVVCTALLEYYAFEAKPVRATALKNFRLLTKSSLTAFIYVQVGYDPANRIPDCWKKFHERVSLVYHKVPAGYFSVFKEMGDFIVSLIQAGVPVDHKTVPDISVGISWGNHWEKNEFDVKHGRRVRYEHDYPDDFPQSKSNPQRPWAYPDAGLPCFRKWMREVYFIEKLPAYLNSQENRRALPPSIKSLILEAISGHKQIS